MKANVFLNKLEKSTIEFTLLRPVHIEKSNDVDLLIEKSVLPDLIFFLESISNAIYWKKTNSRKSLQIVLNDSLTLDIQFSLSFLPYKLFQVNKAFHGSRKELSFEKTYVFPNLSEIDLFCFWSCRILLDKKDLASYGSLSLFKKIYGAQINDFLSSEKFNSIVVYLFGEKHNANVIEDLNQIVNGKNIEVQQKYARLLFREHKALYLIKVIFEIKFKIQRRLGVFKKKRNIDLLKA